MERHAYLIMAHNHFDFLKELLGCLDDSRNDIYLHIDKKAGSFDPNQFTKVLNSSRLFFTERLDVRWGGYSQIACELLLLKTAILRFHTEDYLQYNHHKHHRRYPVTAVSTIRCQPRQVFSDSQLLQSPLSLSWNFPLFPDDYSESCPQMCVYLCHCCFHRA